MSVNVTIRLKLMRPPDFTSVLIAGMQRATALVQRRAADLMSGVLIRRRTGALVRSLNSKVEPRPGYVVGVVGIRQKTGWYALWLEEGSKPHALNKGARTERRPTARRRRGARGAKGKHTVMAIPVGGQVIFRTAAQSPGIAPRRFLARAAEGAKQQIHALFTAEARRAIEQARG